MTYHLLQLARDGERGRVAHIASDSGLNAAPSTAMLAPKSEPAHAVVASSTIRVRPASSSGPHSPRTPRGQVTRAERALNVAVLEPT